MKRVVFGMLLFLLSACTSRLIGHLDKPLSITVSKSQAAVGEPVTVILTGGFANFKEAKAPDYIVPNFRLGACFYKAPNQFFETQGGLCLDKDLPIPSYIMILEGQSYRKTFGKQVIKSGEEVVLKYTFSFTSTTPGSVSLSAMSQIDFEGSGWSSAANSLAEAKVQFK